MLKQVTFLIIVFCLSIVTYGQTDGNFNCDRELTIPGCNAIPNPNFSETNSSIIYGDFYNNNIAYWYDSHGTSDVNRPGLSAPFFGANPTSMAIGAHMDDDGQLLKGGEGIVVKTRRLQQGKTYMFSMFVSTGTSFGQVNNVELVAGLIGCQNFGGFGTIGIPPLGLGSQKIYCETFSTIQSSSWKQVVVKFTANSSYDMLRIFPDLTSTPTSPGSAWVHVAYPELVEVNNFSATLEFENSCDFTISANNCGVKNAVFTWRDPQNNIVQQGSTQQLNGSLSNMPTGNYTLSMTVPGATGTNNSCSENNPVFTTSVEVAGNICICSSLSISGSLTYWRNMDLANFPVSDYTTIDLNCSENTACHQVDEGNLIFNLTSSNPSGNIWEIYADNQLVPNSTNLYSGSPVNNLQTFQPEMWIFAFNSQRLIEIRLTNTITSQVTRRFIKVNPQALLFSGYCNLAASPSGWLSVEFSNIQHVNSTTQYIWDLSNAPSSFQFTQPSIFSPNLLYNPASFSQTFQASLRTVGAEYCDRARFFSIGTSSCYSYGRNGIESRGEENIPPNEIKAKSDALEIFPNPNSGIFNVRTKGNLVRGTLYNINGIVVQQFNKYQLQQPINITELKPGTYFLKIFYNDKDYEIKSFIKL
jgi:hypothetical protein